MSPTARSPTGGQLCSVFSRANGEDPGGSAPHWDRCLIVELAKPWKGEVAESRHFPAGVTTALGRAERAGRPTRLQCVTPDREYSVDGHTRVMLFSKPPGPFVTYVKDDYLAPSDQVGPLVRALLRQSGGLQAFDRYRQDTDGVREILVCAHGARDNCCASFGNAIYHILRHQYAQRLDGRLRVWSVSHLGGHRFAPNIVDLPEGRNWVRLGPEQLDALVYRNRPVSEMRPFYRGWTGLDTPYEQMAEREVLMAEGWDWTQRYVTTRLVQPPQGHGPARVRIDFSDGDGHASGAYEATVEAAEAAPTAACLNGGERREAEQYTVTQLEKVR